MRVGDDESTGGAAGGASGLQFLTGECHRLVLVEVAVCLKTGEQGSEVVGANSAVEDLALADVCLRRLLSENRGDLGV